MKVALVGNQNSGKSTLFNSLTGANQKIGNWPGVTIEKKSGMIRNTNFELIDLPGIYSLNSYTKEEEVTNQFLNSKEADVIINMIDCNSISRGLYLTLQMLEQYSKVIVLLNMYDSAEKKGIHIDDKKLSKKLGNIPVIKISALSGEGLEKVILQLKLWQKQNGTNLIGINKEKYRDSQLRNNRSNQMVEREIEEKYQRLDTMLKEVITISKEYKNSVTDKLDKIFLNKILAIPIFALLMLFVYFISIEVVGNYTVDKMNQFFDWLGIWLKEFLLSQNASHALTSLIVDGILHGVSAVISFLPQLTFLYIMITVLEKVGYMSRISLIFDKIFKRLGMSGNSVISFILGAGCSVPGIMATRTIKDENEKITTSVLTPFIPCSAKLPIISLFSTYFFRKHTGIVALSFYMLAIIVIIFSSVVLKKIQNTNNKISYVSELPEYHLPKWKQILKDSLERVWDFVKRAGSIILVSSIVVWILLSYSIHWEYGVEIQDSILANIGRCFSWLFVPMVGENHWEIAVSSLQGLIAKEQVISSMAIIAGLETENVSNHIFATGSPFTFFTPLAGYAYVCFNLFSAPCFGAISAMRKTLGSTKKMLKAVTYQIVLAYIFSCAIYQIGILIK